MCTYRLVIARAVQTRAKLFAVILLSAVSACGKDPIAPSSRTVDACCVAAESLVIEAASPTQIGGTVGDLVRPVPAVIVKTPLGQPVSGITVSFDLAGGPEFGGSVTHTSSVTNSQGIATPGEWRLATRYDVQELIATLRAAGPSRSVKFRVQAAAGEGVQLFSSESYTDQAGLPNWQVGAPTVWLRDKFGNRVPQSGVVVSFVVTAGGGQLSRTEARTNENGAASAEGWTLGPRVGVNSIVASAASFGAVTFTVQALDTRQLAWYDMDTVDNRSTSIKGSTIGLSENGYFVEESFYENAGRRWLSGKYGLTGTQFRFKHWTGTDGSPTWWDSNDFSLVGDRLTIRWCPPWYDCDWAVPAADEIRTFTKRKSE